MLKYQGIRSFIQHLNIDYFKLMPCSNTQPHNHKNCVNYHNAKDRKRPGNFYSETMCKYVEEGKKCPMGDECPNAHSRVEVEHLAYQSNCIA